MPFGYSIVKTDYLKDLKSISRKYQGVIQVHRWFSGWKDLEIIFEYIFSDTYFGDISSCRDKYAEARNTTVYGKEKL